MFTENALFLRYGRQTFSAFWINMSYFIFTKLEHKARKNEGLKEGEDAEKGKDDDAGRKQRYKFSFICYLKL